MTNQFISQLLSIFSLCLISCSKDKEMPAISETVEITILKPTENQSFKTGDTIQIRANITSNMDLHGWGVSIRRKGDDSLVYSWANHYHAQLYNISPFWINTLNADTTYFLSVDAATDHSGGLKSKKIQIKLAKT